MTAIRRSVVWVFVAAAVCAVAGCSSKPVPVAAVPTAPDGQRHSPDDAPLTPDAENTVDVKFMLRGYCYGGSTIEGSRGLGGYGPSDNMPSPITSPAAKASGACYLLAQPTVVTDFADGKGMRLVLVNATNDAVELRASDSRLYIVQEAKDETGTWQPIEYLPSSWCGNSYHSVVLGSGEFWAFPTPRYRGTFPTTLRFRLTSDRDEMVLVSNEFEGSINPEQFTVKQSYQPSNVMDPYPAE